MRSAGVLYNKGVNPSKKVGGGRTLNVKGFEVCYLKLIETLKRHL